MISILRRPPDLRQRPRVHHGDLRRRRPLAAAGRAVPADHPADGPGLHQLSGGQRPGRFRHRRRPDRAAGQRGREHALHVLDLLGGRDLRAGRHLRHRHQPGHRPGAGAEPRRHRHAAAARRGAAAGGDDPEAVHPDHPRRHVDLAAQDLRQPVHGQLRHPADRGRPEPGPRRRPGPGGRRRGLRHAGLDQPGQAPGPQPDHPGRGRRPASPERAGGGRPGRPAARPRRPAAAA